MPGTYQVHVYNPVGVRQAIITDFLKLELTRKREDQGVATLLLPSDYASLNKPENKIEVWRSIDGNDPYLEGDQIWTVRKNMSELPDNGTDNVTLTAYDGISYLKRRKIAYAANTTYTQKSSLPADNMMKALVRENAGSLATDANRNISSYLAVQNDLGLAPTTSKSMAWKDLVDTLKEIAATSCTSGTFLTFDVVYNGTIPEFRTYIGQRGVDHRPTSGQSQNVIILDPEMGNLGSVQLVDDYTGEANFIYGLGQGENANRTVRTAEDDTRIGISPIGRIETTVDARNSDDPNSVQAEANAALREMQPKVVFSGAILETETFRYGRHYGFGDVVTAQFKTRSFDCRIDVVHITVDNGKETIDVKLQYPVQ